MSKLNVENRHGKKVAVDEVTGKIKLAQSLGLNVPYGDKFKILQEMEDIKQKFSPEQIEKSKLLQKERNARLRKKYDEWVTDRQDLIGYENIVISNENHVIIKVFYFQELSDLEVSSGGIILTDIDSTNLASVHKILPVAKVLASNSDMYNIGDIVVIPAVMSKTKISDEWIQWQKDIREQPTLQREEAMMPPMYTGMLSQWGQYIFQLDPCDSIDNPEVQHTFCIPSRLIQAIL